MSCAIARGAAARRRASSARASLWSARLQRGERAAHIARRAAAAWLASTSICSTSDSTRSSALRESSRYISSSATRCSCVSATRASRAPRRLRILQRGVACARAAFGLRRRRAQLGEASRRRSISHRLHAHARVPREPCRRRSPAAAPRRPRREPRRRARIEPPVDGVRAAGGPAGWTSLMESPRCGSTLRPIPPRPCAAISTREAARLRACAAMASYGTTSVEEPSAPRRGRPSRDEILRSVSALSALTAWISPRATTQISVARRPGASTRR